MNTKNIRIAVIAVSILLSSILSACSNDNPINHVPFPQQVEQVLAGDNPQNVLSGGN